MRQDHAAQLLADTGDCSISRPSLAQVMAQLKA